MPPRGASQQLRESGVTPETALKDKGEFSEELRPFTKQGVGAGGEARDPGRGALRPQTHQYSRRKTGRSWVSSPHFMAGRKLDQKAEAASIQFAVPYGNPGERRRVC